MAGRGGTPYKTDAERMTQKLQTLVDVDTKTALKLISLRSGISMSDIIRIALKEFLENRTSQSTNVQTLF